MFLRVVHLLFPSLLRIGPMERVRMNIYINIYTITIMIKNKNKNNNNKNSEIKSTIIT